MISETALKEFKKIWADEGFGEISDEEAMELSTNLLNLFHHIYRPVKKEWLDAILEEENLNKT